MKNLLSVTALVLSIAIPVNSETGFTSEFDLIDKKLQPFHGWGSLPVSESIAAMWGVRAVIKDKKEIPFVIFMRGAKGWYQKKTSFKHDLEPPTIGSDWKIGEIDVNVKFYTDENRLTLFGKSIFLHNANLVLVDGIDGPTKKIRVIEGGLLRLILGKDENPITHILKHVPEIKEFTKI